MNKLNLLFYIIFLLNFSCNSDDSNDVKDSEIICGIPTNITISNISSTSASINWQNNPNQTSVTLEYGLSGFELGSGTNTNLSNSPFVLTQLTSNTNYDIYLKTLCEGSLTSEFSQLISFKTLCENFIYNGDVVLSNQQELDEFGFSCYTEIIGSLTIDGSNSDITSLASLNKLTKIQNHLTITGTQLLTTLNGLENLEILNEGGLRIISNSNLISLEGLNSLIYVESDITIYGNNSITSLNGLQNLFETQNEFYEVYIRDNPQLSSLNMENITYLNGLYLYNNDLLTTLDSLEDINMNNEMYIEDNDILNDFCSLQNLFSNGMYDVNFINIQNNLFNPSVQDIIDGTCSQ